MLPLLALIYHCLKLMKLIFNFSHFRNISEKISEGEETAKKNSNSIRNWMFQEGEIGGGSQQPFLQRPRRWRIPFSEGSERQWSWREWQRKLRLNEKEDLGALELLKWSNARFIFSIVANSVKCHTTHHRLEVISLQCIVRPNFSRQTLFMLKIIINRSLGVASEVPYQLLCAHIILFS